MKMKKFLILLAVCFCLLPVSAEYYQYGYLRDDLGYHTFAYQSSITNTSAQISCSQFIVPRSVLQSVVIYHDTIYALAMCRDTAAAEAGIPFHRNLEVYLAITASSSYSSNTFETNIGTKVFDGWVDADRGGFLVIPCSSPFYYHPQTNQNLMITIYDKTGTGNPTSMSSANIQSSNSDNEGRMVSVNTTDWRSGLNSLLACEVFTPYSVTCPTIRFYTTPAAFNVDESDFHNDVNAFVGSISKYGIAQMLYKPTEVGMSGAIRRLDIKVSNMDSQHTNSTIEKDLEIYLANSSRTNILCRDYESAWNMTKVFDGHLSLALGWNDINFQVPFNYNGTDNLLVCVLDKTGDPGIYFSDLYGIDHSYTSVNRSSWHFTDNLNFATQIYNIDNVDFSVNTIFGYTPSGLPNMHFYSTSTNATNYGIVVGNVEISSDNNTNFTHADCPNLNLGTVSYDPATKVLRLDNVVMNSDIYFNERFVSPNLTVNLVGNNRIVDFTCPANADVNVTMTGAGQLKCDRLSFGYGEDLNLSLKILNTTVEAGSKTNGMADGIGGNGMEHLTIENSNVTAYSAYYGIGAFNDITLTDCSIAYPQGATVANGTIVVGGDINNRPDTVVIVRTGSGLEITRESEFQVVPNPVADFTTLELDAYHGVARLQIVDVNGRLVAAVELPEQQERYRLDASALATGIYYITVTSNDGLRQTAKLVKK